MAYTIKFTDKDGVNHNVEIDPSKLIVVTVEQDTTPFSIKTISPSYAETTEFEGGRKKR